MLRYRNAPAAIEWLGSVFGFEKHLAVMNADAVHQRPKTVGARIDIDIDTKSDDHGGHSFSVQVRAGVNVAVVDWLGLVGNSGNTGKPRLHVHAQGQGSTEPPLGGDPRPIQFNGRFPVRGDRIEAP